VILDDTALSAEMDAGAVATVVAARGTTLGSDGSVQLSPSSLCCAGGGGTR
jgi:hypothetical protein